MRVLGRFRRPGARGGRRRHGHGKTGVQVDSVVRYVEPRGVYAFDVCAASEGLMFASGSVTIVHDGAHGQLSGKIVQLDGATGATYDTPLTARPR